MGRKGAQELKRQDHSNQKSETLTLRNGAWHVGEKRLNDFREALQATLRAAEIAAAVQEPPVKKQRGRPHWRRRLEARPWWPAYLAWRAGRTEIAKGDSPKGVSTDNPERPKVETSSTLRERAMAALAERRRA